ncbi:pH-response regulator protein palH/rim21 [Emmonsiellopsis sp. PD_33]|nr:pH-response regulator protein palH/rim21 [Emmonsiellopsis sp. PD_33]
MSFVGWLLRSHGAANSNKKQHVVCPAIELLTGGTVFINSSYSIVLTENAAYKPYCEMGQHNELDLLAELHEPFYASTSPQMYAIATATVISYLLVIILFITPRTFFVGGRGGGASFLSRRGILSGSYSSGSSSIIGVGGRPWLQKVAAITVAISLSIATADSFRVAKEQYDRGYMDSSALTLDVIGGLEIRIVRVISSTFLWLAQVQTLIRLFPRHKEKVIIKWTGFALIVLDTIFSILNSFINRSTNPTRPRNIAEAIPALNYLFDLSLSLLYAAWVIFYSLSKHRFAYFHVKMRNICLVALLSLIAVLIPIVFFVLDLSKPDVAGWGEYIRWVGAAAASVVVWEWVERIEALERDERKDGILGREIFDGDEMLEVTPSEEVDWPGPHHNGRDGKGGGGTSSGWGGVIGGLTHRPLRARVTFQRRLPRAKRNKRHTTTDVEANDTDDDFQPTPPPLAITPVSRADTTSAASTMYRVRYHSVGSLTTSSVNYAGDEDGPKDHSSTPGRSSTHINDRGTAAPNPIVKQGIRWAAVPNPFKRRRASPPTEVATAQATTVACARRTIRQSTEPSDEQANSFNIKTKVGTIRPFRPWDRGKSAQEQGAEAILPVTVIPAPARGERIQSPERFESPDQLRDITEDATSMHPYNTRTTNADLPVMVIPAQPRSRTWSTNAKEIQSPTVTPQPPDSTSERRTDPPDRSSTTGRASPMSTTSPHRPESSVHDSPVARRTYSGREVPVLREEEAMAAVHPGRGTTPSTSRSPPPDERHASPPAPIPPSSTTPASHTRHISFSSIGHAHSQPGTASETEGTGRSPMNQVPGGHSDLDLEAQHPH